MKCSYYPILQTKKLRQREAGLFAYVIHSASVQTEIKSWICLCPKPGPVSSLLDGLAHIYYLGHIQTCFQDISCKYQPLSNLRMSAFSATDEVWLFVPDSFPHNMFFYSHAPIPFHSLISTTSPTPCLFLIQPWLWTYFKISSGASSASMKIWRC